MASNALKQLIADAAWGDLDYFLIDLPPGTSDIHLTVFNILLWTVGSGMVSGSHSFVVLLFTATLV